MKQLPRNANVYVACDSPLAPCPSCAKAHGRLINRSFARSFLEQLARVCSCVGGCALGLSVEAPKREAVSQAAKVTDRYLEVLAATRPRSADVLRLLRDGEMRLFGDVIRAAKIQPGPFSTEVQFQAVMLEANQNLELFGLEIIHHAIQLAGDVDGARVGVGEVINVLQLVPTTTD